MQKPAQGRAVESSSKFSNDDLVGALRAQQPYFVRALFFGVAGNLLVLAPVVYMFQIYGRVIDTKSYSTMLWLIVLVFLAYLVMELLDWARAETLRSAAVEFENVMTSTVFNAMFALNRAKGLSGQTQPIQDLRLFKEFLYSPVLMALLDLPMAVFFLFLVFALHPWLGLVTLFAALIQIGFGLLHGAKVGSLLLGASKASSMSQQYASSALRNARLIEAMGMYVPIQKRWRTMHDQYLQYQTQAAESSGGFQAATKTMQLLLSSALLGLGAWILLDGVLPGGSASMIIASTLGGRVLAPAGLLVGQWRNVVQARESYFRLADLLNTYPPAPLGMPLPPPSGKLVVEPLVAAAPNSTSPILRGIQFQLNPGEVLAVIGASGSGKTTLARLLVGIWRSLSGKVRLDGVDISSWNKIELGPHIGYLPQTVELIDGSVAENVARFGVVDLAKVKQAIKLVGLDEVVVNLPQGYETQVGRDGQLFSGGQAQRLGLARAIYKDPKFIVLDEPSSSLDQIGDSQLLEMVMALKNQGVTFVLITHRKNLIKVADKVLVLREGTQQAFGPTDQIMTQFGGA